MFWLREPKNKLPEKWKTYLVGSRTTINLNKTKEIVVKGKAKRPLPTNTFDIKQEAVLKLLGVSFHTL